MSISEKFLESICRFIHYFFPYNLYLKFYNLRKKLRSFWISSDFLKCGTNFSIGKIKYLKGLKCVKVGNDVSIDDYICLTAWQSYTSYELKQKFSPVIEIGDGTSLGAWNHITAINKIIIGEGCLTGKWVTITDNSHGDNGLSSILIKPLKRPLESKGPIIIGKNVWIGDKATILPNVVIGEGAVIGANAVVTKNIPPYSVVGGNPARVLRQLK